MPELSAFQLIVGFLLLLTPVVFFHELGHYWVARRAGVVVEVFSVGFGPEIYGWTSGKTGTRWRIAAIPLGGYVRMRGDENEASGAALSIRSPLALFALGFGCACARRARAPRRFPDAAFPRSDRSCPR